eukprot:TRINITY_DN294_c0_g1_i2.p1 TRINITY_DN294_c0_g1~~TRINITY_DN294_c0_g1_i2.p1  ORF type:complete len:283 (-),score=56.44 TRINITY_DN294_c0_g1_i2:89-937(-)
MSDAGGRSKAGSEKKRGRQQETKVVKELKEEDDEGIEVLLVEEEEEGREEEEEEREWPARRTRRERKERRKARSASPAPYSRSTQPSLTDKPEAAEAAAAAGGGGGGERRERGRKRGGSRGAWGRQRSASTGRRSPSRLAGGLESDFQATTLVYAGDLGGPELDELNLDIEKRFGEGWRIVYLEGAMGERDLKAYTNSDKVERMPHYDLAFPAVSFSSSPLLPLPYLCSSFPIFPSTSRPSLLSFSFPFHPISAHSYPPHDSISPIDDRFSRNQTESHEDNT